MSCMTRRGCSACWGGPVSLSRTRTRARMFEAVMVCSLSMAAAATSTANLVGEDSGLEWRAHEGSRRSVWEFGRSARGRIGKYIST
jgi:hypothetical protein